MEWVVVDRTFPHELTADSVKALAGSPDCFDLYRVEGIRSYLSPDRKRMVCIFRAPDAESVRTALRISDSPPAIVWSSTLHTP